ncbi:MAG: hypothetical protein V3U40_06775 [Candidatus Scalindua sediminis]
MIKPLFRHFNLILTISLVSWLLVIPIGISDASDEFFEIKPKLNIKKPPNKEERLTYARALYKKINQIYDAIPNLSPSQKKWLDSEMSSENVFRRIEVFESDEKYLQDTKSKVETIQLILTAIVDGNYQEQREETFSWLLIASGMVEWDIPWGIAELVNRKLITISSDKRFGEREVIAMTFNRIGRSILNTIVTSYLSKRLPE